MSFITRKSPRKPATCPGSIDLTARQGTATPPEGYYLDNVLASYVHLHFGSNPEVARNLVSHAGI